MYQRIDSDNNNSKAVDWDGITQPCLTLLFQTLKCTKHVVYLTAFCLAVVCHLVDYVMSNKLKKNIAKFWHTSPLGHEAMTNSGRKDTTHTTDTKGKNTN
jgi:hypothetical protein